MAFKSYERDQMKAQLQTLEADIQSEEKSARQESAPKAKVVRMWPRYLAVAASVALLIGAFFWLNPMNSSGESELFAQHYEPYPNVIAPIQKSGDQPTAKEQPFQDYERGDYEAALEGLNNLDESPERNFFQALSLIGLERYDEAKTQLSIIGKTDGARFQQAATWYLALIEIRAENWAEAKIYLQEAIAINVNTPLARRAKRVLEKIE